jgi:hypothetical protein
VTRQQAALHDIRERELTEALRKAERQREEDTTTNLRERQTLQKKVSQEQFQFEEARVVLQRELAEYAEALGRKQAR